MARRLGIYTLGHFMSLNGPESFYLKKLWNPLLQNFESWELSQLSSSPEDMQTVEQSLEGMLLTHGQILNGYFPLPERIECLKRIRAEFLKNFDNLVQVLSMEVHKPLSLARVECERCVLTLDATIEWGQKLLNSPLDMHAPATASLKGHSYPAPRKIIVGATPFNFPLNLSLHKIAPAILAGAPFIWRPSSKGQLSGLALVDILHAAKLPAGLLAFLPMNHDCFWKLLEDPRVEAVSFTGSAQVGWDLQKKFRGPCVLELGGAAPIYIEKLEGEKFKKALQAIAASAYSFSGQSCISAQNLFIHEDQFEEARKLMQEFTQNFAVGKTWDEKTLCSSVIDEEAHARIEKTLSEAKKQGATLHRSHSVEIPNFVAPTLVENPSEKLLKEEIFAPVLNLMIAKDFAHFAQFANALPHRLQCGVFSTDESTLAAAKNLDYGGISLNAPSSVRIDALPYGGRGLAGLGAEAPAITWAFCAPHKTIYSPKS